LTKKTQKEPKGTAKQDKKKKKYRKTVRNLKVTKEKRSKMEAIKIMNSEPKKDLFLLCDGE